MVEKNPLAHLFVYPAADRLPGAAGK